MVALNALDASFIHMESTRTPMHIGGLMVFKLPEQAPPHYLSRFYDELIKTPITQPPFNWCLAKGRFARLRPRWKECHKIDISYHVRHSALPWPGGEKELGSLVARLHSNHLDMDRPLWEFHLIEGLENNRFAIYMKTHHAMIDGLGAMKMIKAWLASDPQTVTALAPWAPEAIPRKKPRRSKREPVKPRITQAIRHQLQASNQLAGKLWQMADPKQNPEGGVYSSLHTPKSLFNQTISPQRRLATQLYDIERFKRIQQATGATVNDIGLAVVGDAIRRYLDELEVLPEHSIIASIPVGLPRADGQLGTNAVGFTCPLCTELDDPVQRLHNIKAITSRTKQQLKELSQDALQQFSVLGITPLMLGQMSGLGMRVPKLFNLVVSNVVATRSKLYLNGAELEAMYPISILFDGYALNITIVGYADRIAVGFTGCRQSLPSLQRLAVYMGDALNHLESCLPLPHSQPQTFKVDLNT